MDRHRMEARMIDSKLETEKDTAGVDVEIEISGKVLEIEGELARIELSVMCDGVKVLGNAKGAIKWQKN